MAEHDEKLFEHEFAEKLRKFDENIRIPEIPDAQSIFERAESEKAKVIPFKKYSRYVAAAAAVVLICVSIPLLSPALNEETAPLEPKAEQPVSIFDITSDNAAEDSDFPAEAEEEPVIEAETEVYPETSYSETVNEAMDSADEKNAGSFPATGKNLNGMLSEFFKNGVQEEIKESSAVSSSDANPETGGNGETGRELAVEYDANGEISMLLEKINKKRSVEVVVEDDFVSVRLFDTSAGDEVISAFWVEGSYEDSYSVSESYLICLSKKITEEDFEEGNYLPVAGDSVNGTYFISEDDVWLPAKVRKGVIRVIVEINIQTGDYKIHASLG